MTKHLKLIGFFLRQNNSTYPPMSLWSRRWTSASVRKWTDLPIRLSYLRITNQTDVFKFLTPQTWANITFGSMVSRNYQIDIKSVKTHQVSTKPSANMIFSKTVVSLPLWSPAKFHLFLSSLQSLLSLLERSWTIWACYYSKCLPLSVAFSGSVST